MTRPRGRPRRDTEAEHEAFVKALTRLLQEHTLSDEELASALVLGFTNEPEFGRLKRALGQMKEGMP